MRLAEKLKDYFPRLPICLAADGLYPNKTFFDICQKNHWDFILTFKDGNLPSVWKEIELLPPSAKQESTHQIKTKTETLSRSYTWINEIDYHGHSLSWVECKEETSKLKTGESTQ